MRLVSEAAWAIMTLWQEARGCSDDEMQMIAEVILQRMREHYASDGTVSGTVLRPAQFSGWNTHDHNRLPSSRIDDTDLLVGRLIVAFKLAQKGSAKSNGALLYYSP